MPNNLPPEHRWKKGQSGNPNGRPKGSRNRKTIVKYWLESLYEAKDPLSGETEEMPMVDHLTRGQIFKALTTWDTPAYKELMDSGYGKVPDEMHTMEKPTIIYDDIPDDDLDEGEEDDESQDQ